MKRSLFVLLLAGCGGTDPMPNAEQQFLGTWSYASGEDDVVCPNGTTKVKLTGQLTVQSSAGGLVVLDAAGCDFSYTVDGQRAQLGDQKSCTFPVPELGQGATAAASYDSITLETQDGKTMDDLFAGKVHYTTPTGSLDCAFSGSATLTRVSGT